MYEDHVSCYGNEARMLFSQKWPPTRTFLPQFLFRKLQRKLKVFLFFFKLFLHILQVIFAYCYFHYFCTSENVLRILITAKTKFTYFSRWPNYGRLAKKHTSLVSVQKLCCEYEVAFISKYSNASS